MGTNFKGILIILVMLGLYSGCSKDLNSTYDDICIDDRMVLKKWSGDDIPFWLADRYYQDVVLKLGLKYTESGPTEFLWVYKFKHNGLTLLALSFDVFYGDRYSGVLCYSDDGRGVDFEKVQNSFGKNATLVSTNVWFRDNAPALSDFGFEDDERLEWLQRTIMNLCEGVRKSGLFLYSINCGYAKSNDDVYVYLRYDYFKDSNSHGIRKHGDCLYHTDGERINGTRERNKIKQLRLPDNEIHIKRGPEFLQGK